MPFHFQKYRPLAKALFLAWLLGLGAIHLYTLNQQPLPWYDETYMASLAVAFHQTHTFYRGIANDVAERPQELAYGPVFFLVCHQVFSHTGFHMGAYRTIVFFTGCLVIWLTVCLLSLTGASSLWQWAFAALVATDPYLFRTFHEGRMDLMAAALVMAACYLLLASPVTKGYSHTFSAGILYCLALLTTPRTGFMLPVMLAGCALWPHPKGRWKENIFRIASFGLPMLLIYPCWVWGGFGGPVQFIEFYREQAIYFTRAGGLPFFFNTVQLPLLILAVMATLFGLGQWAVLKKWLAPFLLPVVFFYALVYDNGTYTTFIVPFCYLIIFTVARHYWQAQSCKSSG